MTAVVLRSRWKLPTLREDYDQGKRQSFSRTVHKQRDTMYRAVKVFCDCRAKPWVFRDSGRRLYQQARRRTLAARCGKLRSFYSPLRDAV